MYGSKKSNLVFKTALLTRNMKICGSTVKKENKTTQNETKQDNNAI